MATYTIVAAGTDPLGPNEIAAGGNIRVDEGDIFIVDSSADANTRFSVSGGGTRNIQIQINDDNSNGFQLTLRSGISSSINVADDVQIPSLNIRATAADSVNYTAGNIAYRSGMISRVRAWALAVEPTAYRLAQTPPLEALPAAVARIL